MYLVKFSLQTKTNTYINSNILAQSIMTLLSKKCLKCNKVWNITDALQAAGIYGHVLYVSYSPVVFTRGLR